MTAISGARALGPTATVPDSGQTAYTTRRGRMIQGHAENVLQSELARLRGHVQLIFTSPPFPLNRKKRYGNLQGDEYVDWLVAFAPLFRQLLKKNGSLVMELGNAWVPGKPVMSTLALKALLAFLEKSELYLCQQFICHNPARLPSPVEWVNKRRTRVKDAYTHVWWMSPTVVEAVADLGIVTREQVARLLKLGSRRDQRELLY